MRCSVRPKVVFLCYERTLGLLYNLADWLSALTIQAGDEFEIVGLSRPWEQEQGLFQRIDNSGTVHMHVVQSLSDPVAVRELAQAAVVHCHGFRQLWELYNLRRSTKATFRCTISIHYFWNGTPWKVPFTNCVSGGLLNKAASTIHFLSTRAQTDFMQTNILLRQTLPYYIFPLGCDDEEFSGSGSLDGLRKWEYLPILTSDRPNIVYLANFTKNKQHRWLIDALSILLLRRNAVLWLLGDGPERQRVAAYVRKRSLGNHVMIPGRIQRKCIPELLSRMQVAVCASKSENSPHGIMEPMFAGVPVVNV